MGQAVVSQFQSSENYSYAFCFNEARYIPRLIFDCVYIDFVDQHKHSGFTLTDNGKWQNHIDNILASASKVRGVMRKLKYTFSRIA